MLTRRRLLQSAAAAVPLAFLAARARTPAGLVPDPAGILDLPEGFSYRILEVVGDPMSDGYRVPGAPDGMACFEGRRGELILLRNHELTGGSGAGPYLPGQTPPVEAFDPAQLGGVTRVVLDERGERISSNLVLIGTARNCAGGTSPWGWLSCEESLIEGHGYVFVCPTDADRVQPPTPIRGYGRFNHEAAAVDPRTMIAYLTEDDGGGCFYRFVPDSRATPTRGRLQAMRIVGRDNLDTGAGHPTGTRWEIAWVDVDDPEARTTATRVQAQSRGAAIVRRGEGLWLDGGSPYLVSTNGGPVGAGQIFRLDPDGDGGVLTLVAQSEDPAFLDQPDNITVAPWGDLVLAEDGAGGDRLVIVRADGSSSVLAQNRRSEAELAGVCFSPDGRFLFVNLQGDGLTLVITGPFPEVATTLEEAGGGCVFG